MVLWLRLSGWACFLTGGGLFLWCGGFTRPKDPTPWVGMFLALLGMILTSLSNLAIHFARMRRLKEEIKEAEARKTGPPGPPPAGPTA